MDIKVTYGMTETEKKLNSITRKLGGEYEFTPRAQAIVVKGLKPAKVVIESEKYDSSDEGCAKLTGLTPAEYQSKHHRAWNE